VRRTNLRFLTADVLNYLIREHGVQQIDLAKVLGVDRSYISRACRGERTLSVEHLRALADHIGIELGILLLAAGKSDERVADPKKARIIKLCEESIRGLDALHRAFREKAASKTQANAA
jgi:transcriptional regulator with XRE-family HTH domain